MNFKTFSLVGISLILAASSCIKEEGLDKEADILSVTIEDKGYLTTIIDENRKEISLVVEGDISAYDKGIIVPKIRLSQRATVEPKSLDPVQLNEFKHTYKVTAEDGASKEYSIRIIPYNNLTQDFEGWYTAGSSEKPYDEPSDPMWTTANGGVAIIYPTNTVFPTTKTTEKRPESDGEFAVELKTTRGNKSTIPTLNIPVFSGSMFRGKFQLNTTAPITSTKFGQPHPQYLGKPVALTAWYTYKAGQPFIVGDNETNGIDQPDIYAVLYKVPKGAGDDVFLTGADINKPNHELIVARADMADRGEKESWTQITTKFVFSETLNFEENDYKLTVILASSRRGAQYEGGIGSTLRVDDLRVICEHDSDAHLY